MPKDRIDRHKPEERRRTSATTPRDSRDLDALVEDGTRPDLAEARGSGSRSSVSSRVYGFN